MQFQKIEVPAGWKEYFSAYPHGLSIWEALLSTISMVNEGIEEVNKKVDEGLLAIDEASTTISTNVQNSFDAFKLELEFNFGTLEGELIDTINDALANVYTKSQVYTKAEIDAQLNDIEIKQGLLSGLLTTAKTSIVNAINELFNIKANKVQEGWMTPTLLNGWTENPAYPVRYMKDTIGFVHIKGRLENGVAGTDAFVLPTGYRPEQVIGVLGMTNTGTDARINIFSGVSGVFRPLTYNAYIYIDNITFKAV